MVTQFPIKFRCYQLRCSTFRTSYNWDFAYVFARSISRTKVFSRIGFVHTHSYAYAEQPTHNLINYSVQILITSLRAIDFPVGIVPQSQTKEVGFSDYEVQVLVVDLRDMLRCACRSDLGGEVFEKRSWYGR